MSADKEKEEVVAIERLELSDDEDDNFKYSQSNILCSYDGITDDFGDIDNDNDDEDFDNLLRTVNKVEGAKENGNEDEEPSSVPIEKSYSKVELFSIDDFIRNFLVKYKMFQSLDTFNTEWYSNIAKNAVQKNKLEPVPDIYVKNQQLETEIHELKLECERLKNIAKTAKGTWDKFRRERDYHRMNHRRVVQEKEKLLNDIRRLERQAKLYEPQLLDLKQRYDAALKEKMMMKLERDKMRAKVETMEQIVSKYEKVESPKQKVVEKTKKKKIEDTKMPPDNATNPYLSMNYPVPEVSSYTLLKTFKGHTSSISCLAYHPKKHILATGSDDSTFKLWGMPNGDIIMAGEGHEDWIGGIEISPKGTQLSTCSGDGTIKIWDFLSSQCVGTLKDHTQGVWDIGYNYTGDFLISGSLDQSVKLWDLNTLKCRHSFRGHVDSVNSVLFQPFSNNICSGSADKTVSLWDMKSGLCVQTFYGHTNAINNVTFNLKGDTIASCDADGIVKLWDVRMVAERFSLNSGEHPINKISIDRSGTYLSAASDDGRIKMFDINKCEYVSELSGHEDAVQCVLFEPHGKYLISGGSDNTFRLWGM